ncbi:MAG: PilW family protein [Aquabacterium sp.]
MSLRPPGRSTRLRQAGLSLVELMVGITIGLFVVAGASLIATNQLADNRRLMLETQIQQDLRAAADIIVRDLRRSGYWASSHTGLALNGGAVAENPYAATSPASAASAVSEITYQYSLDGDVDNGAIDAREQMGVRLEGGVVQMRLGESGWQALTDAGTVLITQFEITVNGRRIDLPCMKACPPGAADCPRRQEVRDVSVLIVGRAVHDARVTRSVRGDTRLRNDLISGSCPA